MTSRVCEDAGFDRFGVADYRLNIVGLWPDPADSATNVAWVRDTYSGIGPHATERSYVNFMADEGQHRVRAAYTVRRSTDWWP